MRSPSRWIPLGVAVAVVAALAWPVSTLTLTDQTSGRSIGWLDRPDSFALTYRHSIIGERGSERFATTAHSFRLVEVSSQSAAVIDYYARTERPRETGDGFAIDVQDAAVSSIPIKVSVLGDRSIAANGTVVHLARLVPDGDTVALSTGYAPRIAVLVSSAMLRLMAA